VKEEEKNRSVEKQIQNGKEEKKNPRNGLDRNGLKSIACVFFLVCRSPSVQKGRGEEAVYRPPVFAAAREPTRRQWRWRVEETRRHCSRAQKPSSTVPGLPCSYCRFLGFYFVIFELYLIYFEVLLFVLHVKKNV